jgi:hypothetical protein
VNTGADMIEGAFSAYVGDSDDARLAQAAAKVEGLCYEKTPGTSTVTARWTRVEDSVALAKIMGWRRVGIATCIGMLAETDELTKILARMDFQVRVADDVIRALAAKFRRPELERTLAALGKLTAYTKQLDMAMFNDAVTDWYRDEFVREHLAGSGGAGEGQ